MYFKGDIIITDPCYIVPKSYDDFNYNFKKFGFTNFISESTLYGDWSCTTFNTNASEEELNKLQETLDKLYFEAFKNYNSNTTPKEEHKVIYYKWQEEKTKVEKESGLVLGHFCADAGLVGVFYLDEVLKFNPEFDYHTNRPWTTTLVENFDGEIEYKIENEEAYIEGKGNINFITRQTGF